MANLNQLSGSNWRALLVLAFLVYPAPFVRADARILNRMTVAGQTLDSTIYVRGSRARTEVRLPDSVMVRVDECGSSRVLHINDRNKTYYYERTGDVRANTQPRTTLRVLSNTRDTGERKQMLDREARHLHTELTMPPSTGACGENIHVVADGWYVNLDFLPKCLTPDLETILRDRMHAFGCAADLHFQSSGDALSGYAVSLDLTLEEGPLSKGVPSPGSPPGIHEETTEISSSPMSADLFQPPEGYREVDSMEELLSSTAPQTPTPSQPDTALPRIGIAYPNVPGSLRAIDVQGEIDAALRNLGRDGVALESETKDDAIRECNSRGCAYVMLTTFTVERSTPAQARNGYRTRIHFQILPIGNPRRTLEGDNFFDGTYAQSGTSAAIEDAVKTMLAQIAKLTQ